MIYKRKRTYRKRPSKLGRTVRRIVTAMEEKKWATGAMNNLDISQAGVRLGLLNSGTLGTDTLGALGIPVGSENGKRIGLKIRLKEVQLSMSLRPDPTGEAAMKNGTTIRMFLIHDRKPQGTLPSAGDIFQHTAGRDCFLLNEANRFRFTIVKQLVHQMVVFSVLPDGTNHSCGPALTWNWNFRPDKVVQWKTDDTDISVLQTHNWYVIAFADDNDCCTLNWEMKMRYIDT